jgi:hypothetical protein
VRHYKHDRRDGNYGKNRNKNFDDLIHPVAPVLVNSGNISTGSVASVL